MIRFKCVCCGEEKDSEQCCSCPNCGYAMYKMPYERRELLKSEIIRFISIVIRPEISIDDIVFIGKTKDENRFPNYIKIVNYVFDADKTEAFVKRLNDTADKINKHFHESFAKVYKADLKNISTLSDISTEQVCEIMSVFGHELTFDEFILPEVSLSYCEKPDEKMSGLLDDVTDRLKILSKKIHDFIVKNNAYSVYRVPPTIKRFDSFGFEKCIDYLDEIIAKKYVVDILDDGSGELEEMLKAFFSAVSLVMTAPMLVKKYMYSVGDNDHLSEKEAISLLSSVITERFTAVSDIISDGSFLSGKSEDDLFVYYNKMLELDHKGHLDVPRGSFIVGDNERKLEKLIGLSTVKSYILKIKAFAAANKNRKALNLHMCFCGNPGTGKTEVARIIAGILHEVGVLPTDKVIETDRSGLVAGYVGQTAMKTRDKINEAMGGVLFIDEAYSLVAKESPDDYGHESVAELLKAMEDYRGKFCVILAGYKNLMEELLSTNPGFRSRIQFTIDFPNYNRTELKQIASVMLERAGYNMTEQAMEKMLDITDIKRKSSEFANAREIRNIIEQVIMCQNVRCVGSDDREIALADVNTYIKDSRISLPTSGDGAVKKILTAEDELEALTGLRSVKRMIKKIKAYAKRNKDDPDLNLHMCFCGNPGTGKTEVARILSRILYEAGVLPEAKLIETDAHGMMGRFVGETAPKTLAKVNDALGGVLFIDEAYAFTGVDKADQSVNYGDEAVAVLLKQMEDKRGQFCVILAGYKTEMDDLIGTNPGLASRVQFMLDFPDYTREELGEIAYRMLEKKHYEIDDDAMVLLLDVCEYYRMLPNFANARTIRNILEQVIMNQNLRTEEIGEESYRIILCDVQGYIEDEGIDPAKNDNKTHKIGF